MASMEQLNDFNTNARQEHWGIDKKIPVALIFVVILQTLGFTWGAATLSGEVKNNGKSIEKLENNIDNLTRKLELQSSTFQTRQDSILDSANTREDMNQLKSRLLTLERRILQHDK